ncbi:MAG: hypothetical protein JKY37_14495 [Nannocystaceae bacterium]|nr:hypothetical protein [Nannocystaceae bacterium]
MMGDTPQIHRPAGTSGPLFRWPSTPQPSARLTVADGDSCVSLQDRTVLGIFSPGQHQLPPQIPAGVDLWFCSGQSVAGNKVGGTVLRARVFGEYTYRVTAPHLLVPMAIERGFADAPALDFNRAVMSAIGDALGATPANAETLAAATPAIAAAINNRWTELGVRFEGFTTLGGR